MALGFLLDLLIFSNVIACLLQFDSITSLNAEHMKAMWVLQFIIHNNLSLVESIGRFYKCFFNCRQIHHYYETFSDEYQAASKIYLAYRAVNHDPLKCHRELYLFLCQIGV